MKGIGFRIEGFGIRRKTIYRVEGYGPMPVAKAKRHFPGLPVARFRVRERAGVATIPVGQLTRWLREQVGQNLRRFDGLFREHLLFSDVFANLVVNEGLDDSLDKHLKGSSYTAAWYVLLTDGTPTVAAGDTMGSHAGWSEVTAYDEAARQTLTLGSVSGQSVDNSASPAAFTIDTNSTTIGGAGVTTDNTKGGSSGTLYGAGAFSAGDKSLDDNDTLNVTVTLTASAS